MKITPLVLALLPAAALPAQDPVSTLPDTTAAPDVPAANGAPDEGSTVEGRALRVAELRKRVHDMPNDLLLGGENVQRAEAEAASFYEEKIEVVDRRLDSLEVELSEKRATYDVALRGALGAESVDARTSAMGRASVLRREISSLESESTSLTDRRAQIARVVDAVEDRGRQRESLAARLEASGQGAEEVYGLLFGGGFGLAPELPAAEPASPLEDMGLVEDLLDLDPVGARRVLFEADPAGYWRRFPLRPPGDALADALRFPPPDLPGSR